MLSLTSLSFAHPLVSSDYRSRLFLSEDGLDSAHSRLLSMGLPAFLLSTCLRVEVVWDGDEEATNEVMSCLYGDGSLSDLAVTRRDEAAFLHLCRIAAGLESPLIGEPEVLGQFRRAVSAYQVVRPSSGMLGKVLDAAVGIGRAVRRNLDDSPNGSLGGVAAGAAASFPKVAILGAGTMARAAAQLLPTGVVKVYARRAGQVAGHDTHPWEAAIEALASYPVLISTVPGRSPLFPDAVVEASLASRSKPLLVIDLGMPPGFIRHREHGAIRYMGIDDVASSVVARPLPDAEEQLVSGASAAWLRLTSSERVGSVIAAMVGQAERAVDEEVQRFVRRLPGAVDPEPILRQLAHTVARRVLHAPISYVGSTERGRAAVELLAEAFGVEDD
ncbi:MAG: hypothetical protein WD269_11025 [Acidimicrobiia bacterium]